MNSIDEDAAGAASDPVCDKQCAEVASFAVMSVAKIRFLARFYAIGKPVYDKWHEIRGARPLLNNRRLVPCVPKHGERRLTRISTLFKVHHK